MQKNWISEADDKLWEIAWNAENNKNIKSEMGRSRGRVEQLQATNDKLK